MLLQLFSTIEIVLVFLTSLSCNLEPCPFFSHVPNSPKIICKTPISLFGKRVIFFALIVHSSCAPMKLQMATTCHMNYIWKCFTNYVLMLLDSEEVQAVSQPVHPEPKGFTELFSVMFLIFIMLIFLFASFLLKRRIASSLLNHQIISHAYWLTWIFSETQGSICGGRCWISARDWRK